MHDETRITPDEQRAADRTARALGEFPKDSVEDSAHQQDANAHQSTEPLEGMRSEDECELLQLAAALKQAWQAQEQPVASQELLQMLEDRLSENSPSQKPARRGSDWFALAVVASLGVVAAIPVASWWGWRSSPRKVASALVMTDESDPAPSEAPAKPSADASFADQIVSLSEETDSWQSELSKNEALPAAAEVREIEKARALAVQEQEQAQVLQEKVNAQLASQRKEFEAQQRQLNELAVRLQGIASTGAASVPPTLPTPAIQAGGAPAAGPSVTRFYATPPPEAMMGSGPTDESLVGEKGMRGGSAVGGGMAGGGGYGGGRGGLAPGSAGGALPAGMVPATGGVTSNYGMLPNQSGQAGLGAPAQVVKLQEQRPLRTSVTYSRGSEVSAEVDFDVVRRKRLSVLARSEAKLAQETYQPIVENQFLSALDHPLSTFSIDVDTAAYAIVRRHLNQTQWPPADAVRVEEMINYFQYDYPQPKGEDPFSVQMDVAECPWETSHQLLRIGLQGKKIPRPDRAPGNLVFLLDVSGSMSDENKLPLLKQGMKLLVDQLDERDRVAIVTYAGEAGLKLDSTGGHRADEIRQAIDSLSAGGSTNGSAGIELAYAKAMEYFNSEGANRVILATDGDLNVGVTQDSELVKLITEKARSGVFLTVLGFGQGNLKDSKLEQLADRGNGIYGYIDNLREARKVLVEQLTGSLQTIAKDVKIRVEFNPGRVQSYRLIGYENRLMAAVDFDNDRKDAGEIGAGHSVTALYELIPTGTPNPPVTSQPLKYQRPTAAAEAPNRELTEAAGSSELLTLSLRYKLPDEDESRLRAYTVEQQKTRFADAPDEFRFATSVAAFGMLVRRSQFAGNATFESVTEMAEQALGPDPGGHRTEFLDLVRQAAAMSR